MDFTPPPSNSNPPPIHAHPISSIPSSRKLPIKRKNPNSNSTLILTIPTSNSPDHDLTPTNNHPPFKFHRVWSEPDEIRLLQGLLECSSQGFSFPKDLPIFYAQFSNGMSQPYSKSQLSEKLRRLRKKFRMISSRLEKGLDKALLSPQDRALYDLSKQLWDPEVGRAYLTYTGGDLDSKSSDGNGCEKINNRDNVEAPTMAVLALPTVVKKINNRDGVVDKLNMTDTGLKGLKDDGIGMDANEDVELGEKEVRVGGLGDELSNGIVRFATTTLADVVDESLKKMRSMMEDRRLSDLEKEMRFEKRWRDQRVAEFDVLAKRLKLIVECSSTVGK